MDTSTNPATTRARPSSPGMRAHGPAGRRPARPVRWDLVVGIVLAFGLLAGGLFLARSQEAARDRAEDDLVSVAAADANFTTAAIADLGRRQAVAGTAALAGADVTNEDLGVVADGLGVGFALLFGPDRDLLAVHPPRNVDAAALVEQFAHLRTSLDGEVGVSATLDAPTFPSGVAIAVAAPFTGVDGRRVLSTAFDRRATILDDHLNSVALVQGASVWLVDDDGGVVASSNSGLVPPSVGPDAEGTVVRVEHEGDQWATTATTVAGTPWRVVAAARSDALHADVSGWALAQPWVLLALAAAGAVAITGLVRRDLQRRAELQEANEELLVAADRTRAFVAEASHDLRTPAMVIAGYAEVLADPRFELSPDDERMYLERLVRSSRRVGHLLDSLMTQALADSNQLSLSIAPVPVAEALGDAIGESQLAGRDVRMDAGPDLLVEADAAQLHRVLLNLLDNAAKYGDGPFESTAEARGETVRIAVRDHGLGVAPDFVPDLFQRFSRAEHGTTTDGRTGSGLGLSVALGITEQMGGTIEYEDASPGARFVVVLPRA